MMDPWDFKPTAQPVWVTDAQGEHHKVYGWATGDAWQTFVPVVANPAGGIGRWDHVYPGKPWRAH